MIQVEDVSKSYGSKVVLSRINLTFEAAKTHVLLGSSGSGKTTLLRIIMGLIQPTMGLVRIQDRTVSEATQSELASEIGYVPQDGGLFPHMTALKNVTLLAHMRKWTRDRIERRTQELLGIVELEATVLKRFPKNLSGGQRQRVALMRAAFLNPELMILDEPLGALDPLIRFDLQQELKKIFDRLKKTVLLVTHDLAEAAFFGHSITLLREGKIVQTGEFHELLTQPKDPFVTRFINAQRVVDNPNGSTSG